MAAAVGGSSRINCLAAFIVSSVEFQDSGVPGRLSWTLFQVAYLFLKLCYRLPLPFDSILQNILLFLM